ncbi:MAG: type II toxin-antitoxin system PemK/MazF family toxin [Ignavibacteria bacterium]|nr:type II toxin-antitoxin system PemK/MazF family toxin [Ignavibacteria bacterium]
MKKGDIILTPFPFTDLSQNKVRPAIILSSGISERDVIICFISSVIHRIENETDILLKDNDSTFPKSGLKVSSLIKTNKIATVDKGIILGKLGELDSELLNKLDFNLKKIFDLKS